MNSPYKGKFKVTQVKWAKHDGLDLVGLDSKELYSTVDGEVVFTGWENARNHSQGFGQYVVIKDENNDFYFFGHMSEIKAELGEVKKGDLIGIEGNTGRSTGSHCHYCVRHNRSKAEVLDVSKISGIPNALGIYEQTEKKSGKTALLAGSWNVRKAPSLGASVARVVKGPQSVTYVDIVPEADPKTYGSRYFYELRDGTYLSTKACK